MNVDLDLGVEDLATQIPNDDGEKVTLEFNAAHPVTIYDKVNYIDMSSLRKHLYVAQLLLSGDST